MDQQLADRLAIRDVIETWVIARDSGDWETFRGTWHDDGYMMATWFQGPAEKFIEVSRDGWEHGVNIMHFLGGCRVTLAGERAIGQTKMTIMQRAVVHDVLCDVACTGRFYDLLERRGGRWGIVLRQPIYEKDRLDPVDPAAALTLDPGLLGAFPEGYRHLAYLQTQLGFTVKRDMPGLRGPEVERLYARGAAWLSGRPLDSPADAGSPVPGPAQAGPGHPGPVHPGPAQPRSAVPRPSQPGPVGPDHTRPVMP
jgi:SnoaL-like domain